MRIGSEGSARVRGVGGDGVQRLLETRETDDRAARAARRIFDAAPRAPESRRTRADARASTALVPVAASRIRCLKLRDGHEQNIVVSSVRTVVRVDAADRRRQRGERIVDGEDYTARTSSWRALDRGVLVRSGRRILALKRAIRELERRRDKRYALAHRPNERTRSNCRLRAVKGMAQIRTSRDLSRRAVVDDGARRLAARR